MYLGKKILGLVPARGGSKGIPGKNIVDLAGKPLIAYTINSANESRYIDQVVVSTDDSEIRKVAQSFGANVIKRPRRLASDTSSMLDVLKHSLVEIESKGNLIFDLIVLLQPTSPLRRAKTIDSTIRQFTRVSADYDSLIPLYPTQDKTGTIVNGYYHPYYELGSRRQDLTKVYRECGTIFIFKNALVRQNKLFGKRVFPFIIRNYEESIDIDDAHDLREAAYILGDQVEK